MRSFGSIGPMAGWELRRLARRGRALRVWLLLLYTLLLVSAVFAAAWFYPQPLRDIFSAFGRLSATEATAFTDRFTLVLLEAQLCAVVALTPALAASAVAEEKDRQTLPLLLTTQLTDREIVFGKAAGRIVFMLLVVTAGLPLLLLTLFFGRVDVNFILSGYATTVGTVMLCAAVGVNAACHAPDFRSALLRAYGRVAVLVCGGFIPPLVFASPFGLLVFVQGSAGAGPWLLVLVCGYPLAQALVGVFLLSSAADSLRLRGPCAGPPPESAFPLPPRPADPPLLQPEHVPPRALPPVEDAHPVLWKERCVGWRPAWAMPSVARALSLAAALLCFVLFVGGAWLLVERMGQVFDSAQGQVPAGQSDWPDGGSLLTAAAVFAAGRYLLPLVVGISGAVAGERYRLTLDALLSTPLNRRAILREKIQANAERGAIFPALAVAAVGMAFTADGGIELGAAGAVLVLGGIGLVIGLGAWLTVRCATDVRAFRSLLPFAVLALGWPVGAWNLLRYDADVPRPLFAQALFVLAGACALAGAVFWWLAGRRLEKGE